MIKSDTINKHLLIEWLKDIQERCEEHARHESASMISKEFSQLIRNIKDSK